MAIEDIKIEIIYTLERNPFIKRNIMFLSDYEFTNIIDYFISYISENYEYKEENQLIILEEVLLNLFQIITDFQYYDFKNDFEGSILQIMDKYEYDIIPKNVSNLVTQKKKSKETKKKSSKKDNIDENIEK